MEKVFTKIYSNENLPFMQLRYSNSNEHFKKHIHSTFSLGVNERGTSVYTNKNKKFTLEKNRLAIINPYETHSCNSSSEILNKYYMMYLDTSWCLKIQQIINKDIKDFVPVSIELLRNKEFYDKYVILCKTVFEENSIKEKENALREFFLEFFALYINEEKSVLKDEIFEKIKNFIDENYKENISLEDLAKKFDLNQYYIIRLFKKHLNLTPRAYLINIKIDKAKNLLKEGISIVDTALECGFYDQSHFHRNFLNFVATTPKQYQLNFVQ